MVMDTRDEHVCCCCKTKIQATECGHMERLVRRTWPFGIGRAQVPRRWSVLQGDPGRVLRTRVSFYMV